MDHVTGLGGCSLTLLFLMRARSYNFTVYPLLHYSTLPHNREYVGSGLVGRLSGSSMDMNIYCRFGMDAVP